MDGVVMYRARFEGNLRLLTLLFVKVREHRIQLKLWTCSIACVDMDFLGFSRRIE